MGGRRKTCGREWRAILEVAREVCALATDPGEVLAGPNAAAAALRLRDFLRDQALGAFAVEGASHEHARMAFVELGRAVLMCGLPMARMRYADALDGLARHLDGILEDQTAESLRRAGVAD